MIAHFAEALPMNRFSVAETITKATISGMPVKPMLCRKSAPPMAVITPRFDQPKKATR
jgi:hypothetical protein